MNSEVKVPINNKFKDTLFRKLFGENKENALSLFNAVNNTSYTTADELEFTTLESVVFMKAHNDVSFIFDSSMSLYEHQSTYNPNMPLRGLLYFAQLYHKWLPSTEELFAPKLIEIPAPRYIVFYNGNSSKMSEDITELKLSSAFIGESDPGKFEWTATMINIRADKKRDILEKCQILKEYSIFVEEVIINRQAMSKEDAIIKAVDDCIKKNVLKDFLTSQRKEVLMPLAEFDETKYIEIIKKQTFDEGFGEGFDKGRMNVVLSLVQKDKLSIEDAAETLGLDVEKTKELMLQNNGSVSSV